jgi:glycosyltransferase involved in cell wall biosynthesis
MRIGIVSYWFNRGQGVVARQLRSALDELGHETFVLARPTKETFRQPRTVERGDVWAQEGVTAAAAFLIEEREYLDWAGANGLEACFFDQNYQFAEVAALRATGVRTLGRFVWERFSDEHVEPARAAFDTIYSLTGAERERYATMGIESPAVAWGCHPDLFEVTPNRDPDRVTLFFHGGLLGRRKPIDEILEAFGRTDNPDLRLLVKAQVERRMGKLEKATRRDPRIELVLEDLPTAEHLQLFADCHVCLTPSRWEGLGLHFYEALAFGMPIITNDSPPMNELVEDGVNGLLVGSIPDGFANSGIPAYSPDVDDLAAAMERVGDAGLRERLSQGALETARERNWERTVADVGELLAGVAA